MAARVLPEVPLLNHYHKIEAKRLSSALPAGVLLTTLLLLLLLPAESKEVHGAVEGGPSSNSSLARGNVTEIIYASSASDATAATANSQRKNSSDSDRSTVTDVWQQQQQHQHQTKDEKNSSSSSSSARLAKTFSVIKTVKNGFDSVVHKTDSQQPQYTGGWSSVNETSSYRPLSPTTTTLRRDEKKNNSSSSSSSSSSSLTDAIRDMTNRRASLRNKQQLSKYAALLNRYPLTVAAAAAAGSNPDSSVGHELIELRPTTPDDFESQAQNYDAEYFPATNHEYEENYNSLPDDQGVGPGYDDAIPMMKDPYRVGSPNHHQHHHHQQQHQQISGYLQHQIHHQHQQQQQQQQHENGFFGPPITTANPSSYYQDISAGPPYYQDDGLSYMPEQSGGALGCHCQNRATRQGCGSMLSEFLGLAGALGGNLWTMAQLIGTSAAPLVIPMLALKLILVPLKIIKFLHLIKIFLKVFIILPFFVRYVYPALYNYTTSLPGLFMQQIQNIFPNMGQQQQQQPQKPHHPLLQGHKPHKPRPYEEIAVDDDDDDAVGSASSVGDGLLLVDDQDQDDLDEDLESRGGAANSSNSSGNYNFYQLVDDSSLWDLRACPSRVACELGAYLAGSASSRSFPPNLSSYLAKKADKLDAGQSNATALGSDEARAMKAASAYQNKLHKGTKSKELASGHKNRETKPYKKKYHGNGAYKNGTSGSGDRDDHDDDDEDDEEDEIQRNAVYKSFILALVRKWSVDQCATFYNCPVLF